MATYTAEPLSAIGTPAVVVQQAPVDPSGTYVVSKMQSSALPFIVGAVLTLMLFMWLIKPDWIYKKTPEGLVTLEYNWWVLVVLAVVGGLLASAMRR